jgi:nitroreductase
MEFIKVLEERRSVDQFDPEGTISEGDIKKIIEAATTKSRRCCCRNCSFG